MERAEMIHELDRVIDVGIVNAHHDREVLQEVRKTLKTGQWVFGNTMGHDWMKCSNCCVSQSGWTSCWTYCPNCGAYMTGVIHDDPQDAASKS